VLSSIIEHVNSSTTAEVGGVLVGTLESDCARIVAAIPAHRATSSTANVTFTHEVWEEVLPIVDNDYPGNTIVGWYHSHPGFGVFLSEYDLFIHRNFFPDRNMVALVVDPLAGKAGWFHWHVDDIAPGSEFDTPQVELASAREQSVTAAAQRRRSNGLVAAAAIALLALIGGYALGSSLAPPGESTSAETPQSSENQLPAGRDSILPDTSGSTLSPAVLSECTYEYTVAPGDSYWMISENLLGDGAQWRDLAFLNGTNPGPDLAAGVTLRIPATNCTAQLDAKEPNQ
jgi:proteasome lid subunit RPN8/RPN11